MQSRTAILSPVQMLQQTLAFALPLLGMMILLAMPAHAQGAPTGLPLDEMMAHFISGISGPFMHMTYMCAYIFGTYLVAKGLLKSVKFADEGSRGQQKFSGIWGCLFVGATLLALPGSFDMISNTLLVHSSDADPALTYATITNGDIQNRLDRTYWTVLVFMQMLGLISFVRGLSILRSVTDGNTQVTSMAGITHMLAGAMAWNLGEFVEMLGHTIGYNNILSI